MFEVFDDAKIRMNEVKYDVNGMANQPGIGKIKR